MCAQVCVPTRQRQSTHTHTHTHREREKGGIVGNKLSNPHQLNKVIELAQPMSGKMIKIQVALIDALDATLFDLKKSSKKVMMLVGGNDGGGDHAVVVVMMLVVVMVW